ncbi:MAG: outer membrane beta-barrel protein [Prevotella sp.]|nr:outer membrane beta-barrel protein [Prevotella sp.]MCM1074597.1 outer membrane beta-barrel protein [Ruminococcus sp.]
MKLYTSLLILLASTATATADEITDSIASAHELEEFVVVGERSWIEGNKAVFLPTKQEKNLATDPASLIQRMKIPMLFVDQGVIKNMRGDAVPVYINGEPADNIDLSTFWAKQTNRVEYIDHPADPHYRGASAVVNIIMPEYEIGGVTKISANQEIPGGGNYDLASKLVYKKMTYGLLLRGAYERNHSNTTVGSESFNNIWYNGEFYDKITRDFSGHTWTRSQNFNVALNARYRTDKTRFVTTLALAANRNPGSGQEDANIWTPSLFDNTSSRTSNNSRSLSPQLTGEFVRVFNQHITTVFNWKYAYAHNNAATAYRLGELPAILNGTRDDTHSVAIDNITAYMVKPTMAFWLKLASNMDWFSTQYTGSADTRQRQWRGQSTAAVSFRYLILQQLSMSFDPGILIDYWRLYGDKTHSAVKPTASLNLNWGISSRTSLSAFVSFFSRAPQASQSGDVIIRQDELNWLQANPLLKNENSWSASLYFQWLPIRLFNMSASLSYHRDENEFISIYEQAPADMGGVIKTYANASPMNSYQLDMFLNTRLFREKINIHLQPVFTYQDVTGVYAKSLFWFRLRTSVSYDMGNFSLSVYHSMPQKWIANGGMETNRMAHQFDIGATYGNGDLYANLSLKNIFNTHYKSSSETTADIYNFYRSNYEIGRSIHLQLTYTFGYGKHIDRNIEIDSAGEVKSGALGSK